MPLRPPHSHSPPFTADYSLKLWDVGEQRCIGTYDCHTDSIWALRANASFTRAYTGGEGCVSECAAAGRVGPFLGPLWREA